MPNRGPVVLSLDEVDALLDALPPPPPKNQPLDQEQKHTESARESLTKLKLQLLHNAVQQAE